MAAGILIRPQTVAAAGGGILRGTHNEGGYKINGLITLFRVVVRSNGNPKPSPQPFVRQPCLKFDGDKTELPADEQKGGGSTKHQAPSIDDGDAIT